MAACLALYPLVMAISISDGAVAAAQCASHDGCMAAATTLLAAPQEGRAQEDIQHTDRRREGRGAAPLGRNVPVARKTSKRPVCLAGGSPGRRAHCLGSAWAAAVLAHSVGPPTCCPITLSLSICSVQACVAMKACISTS